MSKLVRPPHCLRPHCRREIILCVVVAISVITGDRRLNAQVQFDRFFPVAVEIGQESTVKAEGKFPTWPVRIRCDREDVKIHAAEESGELQVSVDPQSPPGVAWVRLHDGKSASRLVPLLIEPAPITIETEPNNELAEATPVPLPAVLNGRLGKSRDVDTYRVDVLSGQTLVVSTVAHRILGSPMDAVLQLVDDSGNVLLQADDGIGLDPSFAYRADRDGALMIRMFAFPETPNSTIGYAGSSDFVYQLRITCDAYVDHVLPLVGNEIANEALQARGWNLPQELDVQSVPPRGYSPGLAYVDKAFGWQWRSESANERASQVVPVMGGETVQLESTPVILFGCMERASQIDRVRFTASKGESYHVRLLAREFGLPTDSVLRVIALPDGNELASNDDPTKGTVDSVVQFTAKQDGELELQISDLVDGFSLRHAYTVVLDRTQPRVSLTLADDRVLLKPGKDVELVVSLTREQGFTANVEVSLEQLPAGVSTEPAISESKGKTSSSVKLKLTADEKVEFQGAVKVIGRVLNEDGAHAGMSLPAFYRPCELVEVPEIWLSVSP